VPDQDSATRQAAINALLASGFPFQTAITKVVCDVPDCRIEAEEFPWRDDTGADRFLDLVVRKHNLIVTIECKKTQKEIYTFLQPLHPDATGQRTVIRSRCLYVSQIQDSSKRWELFCGDWDINPESPESAFCVVATSDSGKDQRLLEKDAQLLVRGTDAFGRHLKAERTKPLEEPDRVVVPVIVTNAKLFKANYDPNDVSLDTGQLLMLQHKISTVEWIRFRKAFTAANRDVGARTVFVVAATSLQTFLHDLDEIFSRQSPRNFVIVPD
jgi:hypothetical protein